MSKIKIAIFDLTGCEGCQFHLLSLNELLLDFFQDFEITNWRLLSEKKPTDFDIAFIEGAVTTKKQIELLKQIRKTSKIVIALGACAITGNIFSQFNSKKRKEIAEKIYNKNYKLKAKFLEPVEKFIKVDEKIFGCPPEIDFFKKILQKFKNQKIVSQKKKVIPPDFTSKIEGHGILKINFEKQKVKFEAEESERLVEGLLLEKDFHQAPFVNSRICGICPVAHNICSWSAIENALKIEISQETIILRKILLAGQIIKSHLVHLFFLVLPDFADIKNSIDLCKKYPAEFHLILNIKRIADKILEIIGGSSSFPTNTILAGFRNPAKLDDLLAIKTSIFEVVDEAEDLINLFANFKIPDLNLKNIHFETISYSKNSYPLYPGTFSQSIQEIILKNSPAKLGVLKNKQIIKTGALSRLNRSYQNLNPISKKIFQKIQPNLINPFNNNLAQAIEILHFLEEIINLIDTIKKENLNLEKSKGIENKKIFLKKNIKNISGAACLEAPRGILFHQVKINSDNGKIIYYNIIPPTQINLSCLQKETQELIKYMKRQNKKAFSLTQIKKQIEQLIRAFDPCITCAVH